MVRNSGSKIKGYDPLVMGVGIEQQDLMNNVGIPNEHDDDAKLFADIGAAAGPNPRGAAALFSGVAKGLEHGARSKSTAKKQAKLERYNKAMDYFREVNRVAAEHKKWYETREFAQQQYLPQVLAYAENVTKLDPQSQRLTAQSILDGWNRTVGDNYKLNSIDGSDPFVMTVSGDDGTQVIDIRTMFAGDDLLQQKLAQKMPEYQLKLQEKREKLQADQNFRQENLELEKAKAGLPNKFQKASNTDAQTQQVGNNGNYGSIPLSVMKGKGIMSFMGTINTEMNIAKDVPIVLNMLEEGRQIINSNPNLGTAWSNLVGKDRSSRAALLDKDTRAAYEKLDKIANRISESFIKAKGGNISDSEREIIKKGLFDVGNSAASNEYNINSVEKELKIAKLRGDFAARELSRGYIATPDSFESYINAHPELIQNNNANASPQGEKMYKVKDPDGRIWPNIPESKIQTALSRGGVIVEE